MNLTMQAQCQLVVYTEHKLCCLASNTSAKIFFFSHFFFFFTPPEISLKRLKLESSNFVWL